jgi:hypothetical protein
MSEKVVHHILMTKIMIKNKIKISNEVNFNPGNFLIYFRSTFPSHEEHTARVKNVGNTPYTK